MNPQIVKLDSLIKLHKYNILVRPAFSLITAHVLDSGD